MGQLKIRFSELIDTPGLTESQLFTTKKFAFIKTVNGGVSPVPTFFLSGCPNLQGGGKAGWDKIPSLSKEINFWLPIVDKQTYEFMNRLSLIDVF